MSTGTISPPPTRASRPPSTPRAPSPPLLTWHRLHLSLAGLLATIAVAASLRPLLADLAWVRPTLVTVVAIVATGIMMRRLSSNWMLAALAQAGVLLLSLTVQFTSSSALFGLLATPTSLGDLATGLSEGGQAIGQSAAPVPTVAGLVLLVTLGVGAIALLVDVMAAGLERPAAAGLALLAVYCVPATVLPSGVGWLYFVVAGAGYLVLVAADATDRITSWGQVLDGGDEPRRALTFLPLRGARRVSAIALVAAVVIPMLTPGLGERLLGNGDGPGQGRGSGQINVINPILTLRDDLTSRDATTVITYTTTTDSPEPLRIASDDYFDGESWAPTTGTIARSQRVQEGLPDAPGLTSAVDSTEESTEISIGNLQQSYLPLPYPTIWVDIDGGWLWEDDSLNVVGDGQRTDNISYVARHLRVTPTAEQLNSAARAPSTVLSRFGFLPEDLPPEIAAIAREQAGGGTQFEQALKIQDYLRDSGGFVYDVDAPGTGGNDSGADAVLLFLQEKRGYCVQFASAMAVMARTLDIPSRVAVGFLPGTKQGESYEITLQDAHAWPELYFEGVGWTRFEPTPAARVPELPGYAQEGAADQQPEEVAPSAEASGQPSAQAEQTQPEEAQPDEAATSEADRSWWQRIPWRLLGVLALIGLAALIPLAGARVSRWLRWRAVNGPGQAAEAAWDELRERLSDLGVGWARSWTPRAVTQRLGQEHSLNRRAQAGLDRLSQDVEGLRYAPPGETRTRDVAAIRQDVNSVVDSVAAGSDASSRRRARWFPRSGMTAIGRLLAMPVTAWEARNGSGENTSTEGSSGQATELERSRG